MDINISNLLLETFSINSVERGGISYIITNTNISKNINDQKFEYLEFQHCNINLNFSFCEFTNCVFKNITFSNFNFNNCRMANCEFNNIQNNTENISPIEIKDSELDGCDFYKCNIESKFSRFYECSINSSIYPGEKEISLKSEFCYFSFMFFNGVNIEFNLKKCDFNKNSFEYTKMEEHIESILLEESLEILK